ncbi:MAG: hypothetical protein O3A21_04090, partial [Proteobacteria bacterium]|nr:hypothetical protein [Pseudomonadota bacterium]
MQKATRNKAEALFAATQKKAESPAGEVPPVGAAQLAAKVETAQPAPSPHVPGQRVLHLPSHLPSQGLAPQELVAKTLTPKRPTP